MNSVNTESLSATNSAKKPRLFYLDSLRALACFFVIVIHAIAGAAGLYLENPYYTTTSIINTIIRCAVPIFFMISGAIALSQKERPLKEHYLYVLKNYCIPLAGGLVIWQIYKVHTTPGWPWFDGLFYNVGKNYMGHLWFLWTLIGIMLVLPILRRIVEDKKSCALYLAFWFFFCIVSPHLPSTVPFLWTPPLIAWEQFPLPNPLFFAWTGYFILGYCFHKWSCKINALCLTASTLTSLALMVVLTIWLSHKTAKNNEFYLHNGIPLFVYTASLFLLFKTIMKNKSSKIVTFVAKYTMGIYIIHIPLIYIVGVKLSGLTNLGWTIWPEVLVFAPGTFAVCLAICVVAKKLPIIKYVLR